MDYSTFKNKRGRDPTIAQEVIFKAETTLPAVFLGNFRDPPNCPLLVFLIVDYRLMDKILQFF